MVKRSAVAPEMLSTRARPGCLTARRMPLLAIKGGKIVAGDVVVIRYEGPKGGPGMREMLNPTSAIAGNGTGLHGGPDYGRTFLRRIQRRFHRPRLPEGQVGGPIALVEEGDIISIDIDNHRLDVMVSDEEMAARKAKWQPPRPR